MENITLFLKKYADYVDILKGKVSSKRLVHSLNVATRAVELAIIYNANEEEAFLAGLLHDLCKEMTIEEMLEFASMSYSKETLNYILTVKPALHAYAACGYLANVLGITNKNILNAIENHVLGLDLSELNSKILYISDLCSIDREFLDAKIVYELALIDCNIALATAFTTTISRLLKYTTVDNKVLEQYGYWKSYLKSNFLKEGGEK